MTNRTPEQSISTSPSGEEFTLPRAGRLHPRI